MQTENDPQSFANLREQQLVEAAKHDPQALSYLYRCHYAAIYGYVYRRIGNPHDANDIVSEVFVSMVRYLARFRWTGVPFRCWLLRIATTQISRSLRKKKWSRLWRPFDETQHVEPNRAEDADGRLEQVRFALLTLPVAFQSVLALHYIEDQSVDSIAQILMCRPGTVKSRLSRGRELLRKKLCNSEEMVFNEQRTVGILSEKIEV